MAEASCTKRTGTSCTHTAKTRPALHKQGLLRISQVKHLGNSCHSHHDHHQHHHDQKARRALQINPARLIVYSLPHDTYTASQMLPRISCGFFFVIYLLAMLALRCGQGGLSLAAASWLPLLPNRSLRAQLQCTGLVAAQHVGLTSPTRYQPVFPASEGGFLTTEPHGSPFVCLLRRP